MMKTSKSIVSLRWHWPVLFLAILNSADLAAGENFWQQPQSQTYQVVNSSAGSSENNYVASLVNTYVTELDGAQTEQVAIAMTQSFGAQSSLSFEYANALDQRNLVLGFTQRNLSLSYMTGSGEDNARIGGDYTGVGPYLFHAGYKQKYDTTGFALDYDTGRFGRVHYGEAKVTADGLLDRRARYLEWSNNRFFARTSRFNRGGEQIGNGVDFGVALGAKANKYIAFQSMDMENNRRMQRIRFQFDGKKSRQYWIDLSAHQNPLYQQDDDFQVMINFKTSLGKGRNYYNRLDEAEASDGNPEGDPEATKKKSGKGWKRVAFIGAGAAAVAALSSSGSKAQDQVTRFKTQTEAAFNVLNGVNPRSISLNREFGGWIFVNNDGSYTSTTPVQGEAASVTLPALSLVIPPGAKETPIYHTHAAFDPQFDNENFSPQDLQNDRDVGVDGYLATPGGQFKYHNVLADTVTTLGTVATR